MFLPGNGLQRYIINDFQISGHCHNHSGGENSLIVAQGRKAVNKGFRVDIQEMFATNKSLETREDILAKLRVVIAAYKTANEGNRPVRLDEVGDYQMPTVRIEEWNVIPG